VCAIHRRRGQTRVISCDLCWPAKALNEARATLEAHGDRLNAAHARNIEARRLLLIGSREEAEPVLAEVDPGPLLPLLTAARELGAAGVAIRQLQMKPAQCSSLRRVSGRHRGADGENRGRLSRAAPACGMVDRRWACCSRSPYTDLRKFLDTSVPLI